MKLPGFFELLVLSATLFFLKVLGLEMMTPVFEGLFLSGLLFSYSLGQTKHELRWTAGPSVLRTTCWLGYAVVLTHLDSGSPAHQELLAPCFVLGLALIANTRWALTRCFDSSRRHVTDGRQDQQRTEALATMLRAVGLVGGCGILVSLWYLYFLAQSLRGFNADGQELMTIILLCGLGLGEAVTALVFGERVCSCCATPSAGSQIMFSRAVGLSLVVAGWSGLVEPRLLVINVGAILYALAVLSSGSPAALPVQFHPTVCDGESLGNALTSVAFSQVHESIEQLRRDVRLNRVRLPRETHSKDLNDVFELMQAEPISVEVGRGLLDLIDLEHGDKLNERIFSLRRHVAMEAGILVPNISLRDNLQLKPTTYVIKVDEIEVAEGHAYPGKLLAIGPEEKLKYLQGESTIDPTYGMPGVWIDGKDRGLAERCGCMIFDAVSVIAMQLTEVIRTHAHELLGVPEVQKLLEKLDPTLVAEVVSNRVSLVELRDILRSLLEERVSIRNLGLILEQLAGLKPDYSTEKKIEFVRVCLSRQICKEYQNNEGTINVITMDPEIERCINDAKEETEEGLLLRIDPNKGQDILSAVSVEVAHLTDKGLQPILITSPPIRAVVRKLTQRSFPTLVILSWNEIAPKVNVNSVAMITLQN